MQKQNPQQEFDKILSECKSTLDVLKSLNDQAQSESVKDEIAQLTEILETKFLRRIAQKVATDNLNDQGIKSVTEVLKSIKDDHSELKETFFQQVKAYVSLSPSYYQDGGVNKIMDVFDNEYKKRPGMLMRPQAERLVQNGNVDKTIKYLVNNRLVGTVIADVFLSDVTFMNKLQERVKNEDKNAKSALLTLNITKGNVDVDENLLIKLQDFTDDDLKKYQYWLKANKLNPQQKSTLMNNLIKILPDKDNPKESGALIIEVLKSQSMSDAEKIALYTRITALKTIDKIDLFLPIVKAVPQIDLLPDELKAIFVTIPEMVHCNLGKNSNFSEPELVTQSDFVIAVGARHSWADAKQKTKGDMNRVLEAHERTTIQHIANTQYNVAATDTIEIIKDLWPHNSDLCQQIIKQLVMSEEKLQALRDLKQFRDSQKDPQQIEEINGFIKSVIGNMKDHSQSAAKVAILDDKTVLHELLTQGQNEIITEAMKYLTQHEVDEYLVGNTNAELKTLSDNVKKFQLTPIPQGAYGSDEVYLRNTVTDNQEKFLKNREKSKKDGKTLKPVAIISVSLNKKDTIITGQDATNNYKAQAKQMQALGFEVLICLVDDEGSSSTVSSLNKEIEKFKIEKGEIAYVSINGHGTVSQLGKQGINQTSKIINLMYGAVIDIFACHAGAKENGVLRKIFKDNIHAKVYGGKDTVDQALLGVTIDKNHVPKINTVLHHNSTLSHGIAATKFVPVKTCELNDNMIIVHPLKSVVAPNNHVPVPGNTEQTFKHSKLHRAQNLNSKEWHKNSKYSKKIAEEKSHEVCK